MSHQSLNYVHFAAISYESFLQIIGWHDMKEHTHREIVTTIAKTTNINQKYIKFLREHTCDPDPGFDSGRVEKSLDKLRNKNWLDQITDDMDIFRTAWEHSHRLAPDNSIILAKAAYKYLKIHNTNSACIYLAWATHFIVDSGTPYHKDVTESYWEALPGNNHHVYETYVDKHWNLFKKSVLIGCQEEIKAPRNFTKSRVVELTKYSASCFNKLNNAVNKGEYDVVNDVTECCIKEIATCTWSLFITTIKFSLKK